MRAAIAVMLMAAGAWAQYTTTVIDANMAEVRDGGGRLRYRVWGPNYQDGGVWRQGDSRVVVYDSLGYKMWARNTCYKAAAGDGLWPIAWMRRSDAKLFKARAVFTSATNTLSAAAIQAGRIESADTVGQTLNTSTAVLTGTFPSGDVAIRFGLDASGPVIRHRLYKSLRERTEKRYYGVVWRVNDTAAISTVVGDPHGPQSRIYAPGGANAFFFEYVDSAAWTGSDGQHAAYIDHNYTTSGGALSGNTEWTPGTYFVTSTVAPGNYNLTIDSNVIIKADAGINVINLTGTGDLNIKGTATYPVYITSRDDNTVGETIATSDGSPTRGDYGYAVHISADGACDTTTYLTVRYSGSKYGIIAQNLTGNFTNSHFVLTAVTLRACSLAVDGTYINALIGAHVTGAYRGGYAALTATDIDTTNTVVSSSYGYAIRLVPSGGYIRRSRVELSAAADPAGGVAILARAGGVTDSLVGNFVRCKAANYVLAIGGAHSSGTSKHYTYRNVAIATAGTVGSGVINYGAWTAGGTDSLWGYDNISSGAAAGQYGYYKTATGTAVVQLYNCGYTGAGTRAYSISLDNSPINANPTFANLPAGCVINSAVDPRPNGYAVTSASYIKHGSTTFTGAALDQNSQSATGYRYAATDTLTPGISYWLTSFATTATTPKYSLSAYNIAPCSKTPYAQNPYAKSAYRAR